MTQTIADELRQKFGTIGITYGTSWDWSRSRISPEIGRMVPIPRQAKGEFFTDFEVSDAERLAAELRKLLGKPVVVTGGGGHGYAFAILEDVAILVSKRPLRKVRLGGTGNLIRDAQDNVIYRDDAPPIASVIPHLRALPEEGFHRPFGMGATWTPFIGSYRITALYGYGAEDLAPTPEGWEED